MIFKKNCWQLLLCGREPGGKKSVELGVCPAASDKSHHNINGGHNAGRHCWKVAGTLCGGKIQGSWTQKFNLCERCSVFTMVMREEGAAFVK